MIVSATSISSVASFVSADAAAIQAPRSPAPRETPAASAPAAPAALTAPKPDDETALRERYFEDMVSSAADLLLRTQSGQGSRFGV